MPSNIKLIVFNIYRNIIILSQKNTAKNLANYSKSFSFKCDIVRSSRYKFRFRFGLSAFQSGFILSVNDIVNMVLVLFVGYLGRTWSKPHFLGSYHVTSSPVKVLFAI